MTVPEAALDIIKEFEGLRLEPYHDCVGFPTIGYGHLLSREKGAPLTRFENIDSAEAERILAIDAGNAMNAVRKLITYPDLSVGQTAALIDFVFNLGGGNLQASTLRKVINRGDHEEAPEQFRRWVYAGATKLPGLVRRRQSEVELWNG